MSSKDATFHAAQDLIYALQNTSPASPLVKLGNWAQVGIEDPIRNIQKNQPPSSTSKGVSQGGSPRETQRGEPRKRPNEKCIPIKTINQ